MRLYLEVSVWSHHSEPYRPVGHSRVIVIYFRCCQTVPTHRVTVLLGSRLPSGGSVSSSLLQLTLLPTAWTPCALDRSSVQLQPLVEASSPGQAWESLGSEADSRSSISTRRPGSRGMPTPGATIVLRLDLTSAAPPPPVIPYLHHGASRGRWRRARGSKNDLSGLEWMVSLALPPLNNKQSSSGHLRDIQHRFSKSVPLCHGPGAHSPFDWRDVWVHPNVSSSYKQAQYCVLKKNKKVGGRVNYLKRFTSLLGGSTLPLSRTLKVNPGCWAVTEPESHCHTYKEVKKRVYSQTFCNSFAALQKVSLCVWRSRRSPQTSLNF